MIEEIRDLYAYDRWANQRVLEATGELTPAEFAEDVGGSFSSVRGTLLHLLGAERIWLSRWKGTSPERLLPEEWDVQTHAEVRARFSQVAEGRRVFLEGLDEDSLHAPVEYRNTRGERFSQPLWELLLHVVNHSTYCRGQLTVLLRRLGVEPVATDLLLYQRGGPKRRSDGAWTGG